MGNETWLADSPDGDVALYYAPESETYRLLDIEAGTSVIVTEDDLWHFMQAIKDRKGNDEQSHIDR
jgi:hypothetical protein